jgi:hypothetical protein
LSDAVDLSRDLRIVRRLALTSGSRVTSSFERSVQVDEFEAMLLEDVIQVLSLVGGQSKLLDHFRPGPPPARSRADSNTDADAEAEIAPVVFMVTFFEEPCSNALGTCCAITEATTNFISSNVRIRKLICPPWISIA